MLTHQVPSRRRGVCGGCGTVTTWMQRLESSTMMGTKLVVECTQCGEVIKQ